MGRSAGGCFYRFFNLRYAEVYGLSFKSKNEIAKLSQQPTFGDIKDGAIALNWKVTKPAEGAVRVSHTGGSLGFSSYMLFCPEKNTGIVLLSNEADQTAQNDLIKLAEKILFN